MRGWIWGEGRGRGVRIVDLSNFGTQVERTKESPLTEEALLLPHSVPHLHTYSVCTVQYRGRGLTGSLIHDMVQRWQSAVTSYCREGRKEGRANTFRPDELVSLATLHVLSANAQEVQ